MREITGFSVSYLRENKAFSESLEAQQAEEATVFSCLTLGVGESDT